MIWLELDPSVVRPGWTPLIITVVLGIAIVLLVVNMRKQLGKINIPPADEPGPESEPEPEPPAAAPGQSAPGQPAPGQPAPRDPPPA